MRLTYRLFWLSLLLITGLLMAACVPAPIDPAAPVMPQSEEKPAVDPTPTTAPIAEVEAPGEVDEVKELDEVDAEALATSLAEEFALLGDESTPRFEDYKVFSLETLAEMPPLWALHSLGMRPFDPEGQHLVALFTRKNGEWFEVTRLHLECADFLWEQSVEQVAISPDRIWLAIHSGVGVHSGCFNLVTWDGEAFASVAESFNSSPGAGDVVDVDGDGQLEVLLIGTEPYVFCYACGVRLFSAALLRWNGETLETVKLTPLPSSADAEVRDLNNRAVELAEASLYPDALALIEQAQSLAPGDQIIYWNREWIRLQAENQLVLAEYSGCPLLSYVFYGDYAAAVDEMRGLHADEIFRLDSPLVMGTAAEGWEDRLSFFLTLGGDDALDVQPDLAPAYFLRGWGRFLANPEDPAVLEDVSRAAQLAPDDALYQESSAYLQGMTGSVRGILPQTVRFAPGATAARITSHLGEGAVKRFHLAIAGGQTLYVSAPADIRMELERAAGQPVTGRAVAGATQFSIPASGNYILTITGGGTVDLLLYIPADSAMTPEPAITESVRFAPGTTGTTIDVSLRAGVPVGYLLNIGARQQLYARVEGNGSFIFLDPEGRLLTPVAGDWASDAEFMIPYTGDYTLVLQGSAPVTLSLEIPPR
jgi:hypothetical protein